VSKMGRLIKIHEIEEFSEIKTIQKASISKLILSNIRNLDEKRELEPFLREILYDPNETPHGPTEMADILTTKVNVSGEKKLTAFVLKGKSFQRVSSRNITHQFARLRRIPSLDLIILIAVGNIQDDAQMDFIQTATDAGCDYLIIDTHDLARLFIAYEKICPKDGLPYNEKIGTCKNGHVRDKGITIEMEAREEIKYTILSQKDVSHTGAKRYSATILLDRHYPKEVIRTTIQEVTKKLKYSNYYRNERVKFRWGKTPAHVIWLFIAHDVEDIQNVNWVCQACWIDPSLPVDVRPLGLGGNESLDGIEILWNDSYKARKEFFEKYRGSKEEVLESTNSILNEMINLAKLVIKYFEGYKQGKITEEKFISKMQEMESNVVELYDNSGNIPFPPPDCEDYDQACQSIFATIHNMFLYYSKRGLEIWSKPNRDWLMQSTIKRFYKDLDRIRFEESKLH